MSCILILNAVLRISLTKNKKSFPVEPFFYMPCMKFLSTCPYSNKPALPLKLPGGAPVTFSLTLHPNFHPNILVFANSPIYRKLIHDNISLVFWEPIIFYIALFRKRYKILFVHINIYALQKLWSVLFWRRYKLFLFINISIIIFVSVILKKIKIIFIIIIYLCCCKYSRKI